MKLITKSILAAGALGAALFAGTFGYVLYEGPRMKVQQHVRAYQRVMPLPPPGAVPVTPSPYLPAATTAATSPRPDAGAAKRGEIYYGYYCLFCHGEKGRGEGPVGESFNPRPADLGATSLSGGSLHAAMLTGIGHEPVLERVVRPEFRWDLVAYLETLRK